MDLKLAAWPWNHCTAWWGLRLTPGHPLQAQNAHLLQPPMVWTPLEENPTEEVDAKYKTRICSCLGFWPFINVKVTNIIKITWHKPICAAANFHVCVKTPPFSDWFLIVPSSSFSNNFLMKQHTSSPVTKTRILKIERLSTHACHAMLSRSSNKWIPIMENCPCLDWKPPSGHPSWTGNHHLHAKWIRWSASAWKIRTPWDWASLHCWPLVLSAGTVLFILPSARIRNRSFVINNAQKIYNWFGMILGQTRKSKDSFLRLFQRPSVKQSRIYTLGKVFSKPSDSTHRPACGHWPQASIFGNGELDFCLLLAFCGR